MNVNGTEKVGELERALNNITGRDVHVKSVVQCAAYTRYEAEIPPDVVKRVIAGRSDLQFALACENIRIVTLPEKRAVAIELTRDDVQCPKLDAFLNDDVPKTSFAVGSGIDGGVYCDIIKEQGLLLSGMTGSGKSSFIRSAIVCLSQKNSPDEMRFIVADINGSNIYSGLPHLANGHVLSDINEIKNTLDILKRETDRRLAQFKKVGCSGIDNYSSERLPRIVVFIDELAYLMQSRFTEEIEEDIVHIAARGATVGIHFVICTQRPSVDVLRGRIKAAIPSRAAFRLASAVESRTALGETGAEALANSGDMLYFPLSHRAAERVCTAYISEADASAYLEKVRKNYKADQLEIFKPPKREQKANGPYLFVSYAHADKERVMPYIAELQRRGINVWYDEGIRAGIEWEEEIIQHLNGCKWFIFFVSQNSLRSENCKDELYQAREQHKTFINALIEDIDLRTEEFFWFHFRYSRYQMIPAYAIDMTRVMEKIEQSIN